VDRGFPNPVGASMDAAWLTRGNGKFTKSKSGHAELIGIYTGEVLASGRRHLHCQACRTSAPGDHLCHINWNGSSKAMEADIIADLVLSAVSFKSANARVTVLVGDEDAATMAKIHEKVPWKVTKVTDYVHGKKNFGGVLFALRHKLLNSQIIEYLKDCFRYALHQHENDEVGLKNAILNIPSHVFDNHDNCGSWCGYHKDPSNYQHKRLPRLWKGSEEDRMSLHGCLVDVCQRFAAKSGSLAACLTSNTNESFNFLVTTLAPKSRHYAGSFSLDRRIDSAVLKKNDGVQFVVGINKCLNLSPGNHTMAYRKRIATERKRKIEKSKIPEEKLKRRKLFKEMINDQLQKEAREGVQYSSALGFKKKTATLDQPPSVTHNEVPEPNQTIVKPKKAPPSGTKESSRIEPGLSIKIVILDTETTGFARTDQILQLSAACKNDIFDGYCLPSKTINKEAAKINKMQSRRGKLYQDGKQVDTMSREELISGFLDFLKRQEGKILIVGHKLSFDLRYLEAEIKNQKKVEEFNELVAGFCDSLDYFKYKLQNLMSHKLSLVCKEVLGPEFTFDAHNAMGDVLALQKCLEKTGFGEEQGRQFSISTKNHKINAAEAEKVNTLAATLKPAGKKISRAVIKNLVQNGFDLQQLKILVQDKPKFLKDVKCCFVRQPEVRCENLFVIISQYFK
jgi:DNA polymerase III epsilon subunit-like protein